MRPRPDTAARAQLPRRHGTSGPLPQDCQHRPNSSRNTVAVLPRSFFHHRIARFATETGKQPRALALFVVSSPDFQGSHHHLTSGHPTRHLRAVSTRPITAASPQRNPPPIAAPQHRSAQIQRLILSTAFSAPGTERSFAFRIRNISRITLLLRTYPPRRSSSHDTNHHNLPK